jgi:hypothetical protein
MLPIEGVFTDERLVLSSRRRMFRFSSLSPPLDHPDYF